MDEAGRILEPLANQELGLLMLYRGRLAMAQLRFAEAERAFARAESIYRATLGDSALDPWGARADRGAALARLGRREEGGRMQQEALEAVARLAGPDSEAHAEVAGKLEETRRLEGASRPLSGAAPRGRRPISSHSALAGFPALSDRGANDSSPRRLHVSLSRGPLPGLGQRDIRRTRPHEQDRPPLLARSARWPFSAASGVCRAK